jgi:peptidoglycan-associated lipoprotein
LKLRIQFLSPWVAFTAGLVLLISCSQKVVEQQEPVMEPSPLEDRAQGKKEEDDPRVQIAQEFQVAYYDFNKSNLRDDAKKALEVNAEWLKKHGSARIQIGGHCDERGSKDYNIKLGEKRADAAKAYLVSLGITEDRISIVSYGAEPGGEKDWDRNRKAMLTIVTP